MGFKHHSEEEITNLEKNTNYKAISIQQNILPNQPPKFIQGAPTNVVLTDFKQLGKSPLIKQEMMGQSLNSPYPDEKKKSKLNIVYFLIQFLFFPIKLFYLELSQFRKQELRKQIA